jgi:hypothetical protein
MLADMPLGIHVGNREWRRVLTEHEGNSLTNLMYYVRDWLLLESPRLDLKAVTSLVGPFELISLDWHHRLLSPNISFQWHVENWATKAAQPAHLTDISGIWTWYMRKIYKIAGVRKEIVISTSSKNTFYHYPESLSHPSHNGSQKSSCLQRCQTTWSKYSIAPGR